MIDQLPEDDTREESVLLRRISFILRDNGIDVEIITDFTGPYIQGTGPDHFYVSIEVDHIFMEVARRRTAHTFSADIPLSDPESISEDRIMKVYRDLCEQRRAHE
jgi:hypothetical protein